MCTALPRSLRLNNRMRCFSQHHARQPGPRLFNRGPSSCFIHSCFVAVVIFAVIAALLTAARIAMPRVATARPALVAALVASAIAPDRRRQQLDDLYRLRRIIAGNDQLARPWITLGCFVPDYHCQARPRMECRRKRIVDQFPALALTAG